MAITDPVKRARGGNVGFPRRILRHAGLHVLRPHSDAWAANITYEIVLGGLAGCGLETVWGKEGDGSGRCRCASVRAGWRCGLVNIGAAQGPLDMMIDYGPATGDVRSETVATPSRAMVGGRWRERRFHAARLMAYDCALKLDTGKDVRNAKVSYAGNIMRPRWRRKLIDNAMQWFFGAMGMIKEIAPGILFAGRIRNMRII